LTRAAGARHETRGYHRFARQRRERLSSLQRHAPRTALPGSTLPAALLQNHVAHRAAASR
jgi:hypothetical protein